MKPIIFTKILMISLSFLLAGCYTKRAIIKADNFEYPASMTSYIHNNNLQVINQNGYEIIDKFCFEVGHYYIGPDISISSDSIDISQKINSILKQKGGDAVINLKFKDSTSHPLTWLSVSLQAFSGYLVYSRMENSNILIRSLGSLWASAAVAWLILPKVYPIKVEGEIIKFNDSVGKLRPKR